MNIMEKLLKADAKKTEELEVGTYLSERLAKILGEKEPIEIKIREVAARRISEFSAIQYTEKGSFDSSKVYDAKLMLCTAGIVEPDIKSEELQKHYNCHTPKDLVEKLFDYEASKIGEEIEKLGAGGLMEDAQKKCES